jgi:tetratricopeptide (TPR) repeat protein
VPFITASNNALADRNFILAIDNLSNGAAAWKKTSVEYDSVAELFFEYSKGNIYMAASKLEYAFQIFYNCRKFADTSRLPFTNPDRSLPFYGMGEVFYEMEEYEFAARCFLKAREIRENVLGLEHVQTASVFNNLAACFYMLGRSQ